MAFKVTHSAQSAAGRLCQSATPLKKKERPFTFCPSPNFGCITCSFPLPKSIKLSADRSPTLFPKCFRGLFSFVFARGTREGKAFCNSAIFHVNDICFIDLQEYSFAHSIVSAWFQIQDLKIHRNGWCVLSGYSWESIWMLSAFRQVSLSNWLTTKETERLT